ncbi:putative coat protein [Cassava Ivorian bacilliform virus]|uniref:putative coat protein n=1 Tax=Cassava Ivorian bacilliform virus TaxID=1464778 RepID=UPI0003F202B7|nr:putative coat protein [Cassava Ivorian bacilliform virus]AHJ89008.1 putative coat protein [Cassava Ivorian bacilliform virus]
MNQNPNRRRNRANQNRTRRQRQAQDAAAFRALSSSRALGPSTSGVVDVGGIPVTPGFVLTSVTLSESFSWTGPGTGTWTLFRERSLVIPPTLPPETRLNNVILRVTPTPGMTSYDIWAAVAAAKGSTPTAVDFDSLNVPFLTMRETSRNRHVVIPFAGRTVADLAQQRVWLGARTGTVTADNLVVGLVRLFIEHRPIPQVQIIPV